MINTWKKTLLIMQHKWSEELLYPSWGILYMWTSFITGANHELNLTSERETAQKIRAEYQNALGFGYDDPIPVWIMGMPGVSSAWTKNLGKLSNVLTQSIYFCSDTITWVVFNTVDNFISMWNTLTILHTCVDNHFRATSINFGVKRSNLDFKHFTISTR